MQLITSTEPLYRRRSFGWSRHKVVFFVCGWRTNVMWYRPVFLLLTLAGYKVYSYEVNAVIGASPRIMDYVAQVEAIKDDAKAIAESLPKDAKLFAMGNSLGSEIALYIMKSLPDVRAAVLNTVRGDTADFLWTAPSAVLFKAGYISQGDYRGSLARKVKTISAHTNLDKLGQRPVLVYYSKADKVIPHKNTEILIHALHKEKSVYKVRHNYLLGHFGASIKNFAFAWRWLHFLRAAGK